MAKHKVLAIMAITFEFCYIVATVLAVINQDWVEAGLTGFISVFWGYIAWIGVKELFTKDINFKEN